MHSLLRRQSGTPSRLLLTWAHKFKGNQPVVDIGCGAGRNAIALARLGSKIVCVDRDLRRLRELAESAQQESLSKFLRLVCAELGPALWPFARQSFSAMICVHFLDVALLPFMRDSLEVGGYLYIETIGGQGENHLDLPAAGTLRYCLAPDFSLEFYRERRVGPPAAGKCAVKLLARKTN
jgi:SAM-dependent methyltransferase